MADTKKTTWRDILKDPTYLVDEDGMKVDTMVTVNFKPEVYVFLFLALLLGIGIPFLGYYFLQKDKN